MAEYTTVGKRIPRTDARVKVTGEAKYGGDLKLPGMLWGKVLHSPHAHARVVNVDTSRVLKLKGVKAVVTGKDTPGVKFGFMGKARDEVPFAIDKVRYIGDEVAAVAAIDHDTAEEALDLFQVDYELLPAVYDPRSAMAEGAPQIHDHAPRNICSETHFHFGDVEAGFAASDYIEAEIFNTQVLMHGFIEPHAALASVDGTGKITFQATKQSPYLPYRHIARALQLPLNKIRMVQPYIGGGFGGKQDAIGCDFAAVLLSKKTKRPVMVIYDQEEVFLTGRRRHPMEIKMKIGMKNNGELVAAACELIADGGAYTGIGPFSIYLAGSFMVMPYKVPNVKYDAWRIFTNKPFSGALRGHGIPQIRFAFDSLLETMALKLGIDPVDVRLKNALHTGDVTGNGFKIHSCGLTESLEKAAAAVNWREKIKAGPVREGNKVRGIGMACNSLVTGSRLSGHEASQAIVKLHEDGSVSLLTGTTDCGQGCDTTLAQILAEELGLGMDDIIVAHLDSETTPVDPGSYGSRVTFNAGNAVRRAAEDVRRQLFAAVAEQLECNHEDLEIKNKQIYVKGSPERSISYLSAVRACFYDNVTPVTGKGTFHADADLADIHTGIGNVSGAYSFGTQVAEVEVDLETGEVVVLSLIAAHDCGYPINPLSVEGQVEGSAAMGQAQVQFEDIPVDKDGVLLSQDFMNYGFPTAVNIASRIETIDVITHDPNGPYGAKEAGEGTTISTLPAIANAVSNAIGVRITELPITRELILRALSTKEQQDRGATGETNH